MTFVRRAFGSAVAGGSPRFSSSVGSFTSRRSLTFLAGTEGIKETKSAWLQALIKEVDAEDKRLGSETYVHKHGVLFQFIPESIGRPRQVVAPDPKNHPATAHELQHARDYLKGLFVTAPRQQLEERAFESQLRVGREVGEDQGYENAALRAATHAQVKKGPEGR